eukprot:m.604636 g.604636  ORF g.604636 m.604636 type:complete len:586 (-) comp22461_c0_seq6:1241-2998(-)
MILKRTIAAVYVGALWLTVSCSEHINNVPSEIGTVAPTDGREIDAMQLAGCNTDCGRVEIKVDGGSSWGIVCSPDHWTLKEAQVICRSLGFDTAFGAMPTFGGASDAQATVISHVNCTGEEDSLAHCHLIWGNGKDCDGASAVGVSCLNMGSLANDPHHKMMTELASAKAYDTVNAWHDRARQRKQHVQNVYYTHSASSDSTAEGDAATEIMDATCESAMSADDSTCEILDGVPLPFTADLVKEAYTMYDQIENTFAAMDAALRKRLCAPTDGLAVQHVLLDLVARGLKWNALGLDLSGLGTSATEDELTLLHELYLSHNAHSPIHWELDQPLRAQAPDVLRTDEERALYATLQRDGILMVDDFGLGDDTLDALERTAAWAIESKNTSMTSSVSGGSVVTSRLELPELEPVLSNESITNVMRAYLGSETTLHGYKLTRLATEEAADVTSYVAARWHHDRAGRRTKMFVFLHDIDCVEGHPTQVATGTHNLAYYRTEEFPMSRYSDEYIAREYPIQKGCGKRGGGFVFDTHTVHKGTPYGRNTRTTVIAEFHNSLKCPIVRAMQMALPCPSGDQFMVHRPLGTSME